MQIDGHHTATYVAARIAGFSFSEAETIAYAAQYVDDATNAGIIQFTRTDYLYSRIASAHKMIDYDNFVDVENHLAWIPFHFLPGNGSLPEGQSPDGGKLAKLICRPDSYIARDMLRYAIKDRDLPRALHRLGIAMHVYADTFSHQDFVGSTSIANQIKDLTSGDRAFDERIKANTKKELLTAVRGSIRLSVQVLWRVLRLIVREHRWPSEFIHSFLQKAPVGHAAADVYPDHPYLVWQYIDAHGKLVKRDNPSTFMSAMTMMVKAMRAWRADDRTMKLDAQSGIGESDHAVIERLFRTSTDLDGEIRRQAWLSAIGKGEFSFGSDVPCYAGKGKGSWKERALGTERVTDTGLEQYEYNDSFLFSDWKLFHDALQAHRSAVIHDILPRYGICAA